MDSQYFIDSHCHLADPRFDSTRDSVIKSAIKLGIDFFMQGGMGPEDWLLQKNLSDLWPNKIGLCFGLHPYWIAAHDDVQCEEALDLLSREIGKAMAMGELGLDFRPHIMRDSQDRQVRCFVDQLELAHFIKKPLVLHLVQSHGDALRIFDLYGIPESGGMLHSFTGSWGQAQDFLNRGLYLSIGGAVTFDKNKKIRQTIKEMPLEYLLIETDSPDQSPIKKQGELNTPNSLWDVACAIGQLRNMDPKEVMTISSSNFKRLFLRAESGPFDL